MKRTKALPALAVTAVSAVLTVAVMALWLGGVMPLALALIIGLGFDGAWLAALGYERRLAAQGDHDRRVSALGWAFGAAATGMLVAHALTTTAPAAWLAVSWLPLAAKALWWLHGVWEATALSPSAHKEIREILQDSRDQAAIARASLNARTRLELVRMDTLAATGTSVATAQVQAARKLATAWGALEEVQADGDQSKALTSVATPATPPAAPRWDLPVWGPVSAIRPPAIDAALTDDELDAIVSGLLEETEPPRSYRSMALVFRQRGYRASDTALRASWGRVSAAA